MDVMAAGVHYVNRLPGGAGDLHGAVVNGAGLLFDGQGVEVGADEQGLTRSVSQDADNAEAADVLGHLEARRPQLLREAARRLLLRQRQLRLTVERHVEGLERRVLLLRDPADL